MEEPDDITHILRRLTAGDRLAASELIPLIYPQLRRLAVRHLQMERPNHTLQPTALVNEVFMRLLAGQQVEMNSRNHFFAVASQVMRRILVDHARHRKAVKRGNGAVVPLPEIDEAVFLTSEQSELVLAVHQCLERLKELDERQAQVVEMRFFGGLTEEEIATVLGINARTVKRDWQMARAWLHAELSDAPPTS